MILWLNSTSFKIVMEQVQDDQIFDYESFTLKTAKNNKIVCIKFNLIFWNRTF